MSISHDTNKQDKVPQGWSYFLDDPTAPIPHELREVIEENRKRRREARGMVEFIRNPPKTGSVKEYLAAFEEVFYPTQ